MPLHCALRAGGLVPTVRVAPLPANLGMSGASATWMTGTSQYKPGHNGVGFYPSRPMEEREGSNNQPIAFPFREISMLCSQENFRLGFR